MSSYLKIVKHGKKNSRFFFLTLLDTYCKWSSISCAALPKVLLVLALPSSSRKTGTESNCNRQVFPLHYLFLMYQVSTHTGSPSLSISKRKQLPKVKKAICLSLNINKNKQELWKINSTSIHSITLNFQKPQKVNFTRNCDSASHRNTLQIEHIENNTFNKSDLFSNMLRFLSCFVRHPVAELWPS